MSKFSERQKGLQMEAQFKVEQYLADRNFHLLYVTPSETSSRFDRALLEAVQEEADRLGIKVL